MPIISTSEVKRIASLARIQLTAEEVAEATKDLGNVLTHFSQIQSIDTAQTPTTDDVTGLNNVTRDDNAAPVILCSAQVLLDNAPQTSKGQIKVKAVFS